MAKLRSVLLVVLCLAGLQATSGVASPLPLSLNLGILSFDVLHAAQGNQLGVNVINLENLTGASSVPPDFPITTGLTFQNLILTILTQTTSLILNPAPLGPGSLPQANNLQFASNIEIVSITLQTTLNLTTFNAAGIGTVTAASPDILFVLSPSLGNSLQPGIDLEVVTVATAGASAVPEPASMLLGVSGLFILFVLGRIRN